MDSEITQLFNTAKDILPRAYAPYSHFHVACVLKTRCGKVFHGVNVENISYSLTCCAEKNAISTMVVEGGKAIEMIMVMSSADRMCPPCGACRQIIREFADSDTRIILATLSGEFAEYAMSDMLPLAFDEI